MTFCMVSFTVFTAAPTIGCAPNRSFPVSRLSSIPAISMNSASDTSVLASPTRNFIDIPARITITISSIMLNMLIFW